MDNFGCRSGQGKLSYKEAKATGAQWYWSNKPCPHGHLSFRYTINSNCRACVQIRNNKARGNAPADSEAVDIRRAIEDRQRKPKDEYDYDL
jgi:hypothetical protein